MRSARSTTSSMGSVQAPVDRYFQPPSLAMNMSDEIRALVGYPMHGSLGFYDPAIGTVARDPS